MILIRLFFFTLLMNWTPTTAHGQDGSAVVGRWKTGTNKAYLDIFKQKDHYFGKVAWLKKPYTTQGKPKTDLRNPESGLRDRPIMGLVILKNFVFEGGDEYGRGTIYDPESGKTYRCEMRLKHKDLLNVRGYIGIKAIGRTDTWHRVKQQ